LGEVKPHQWNIRNVRYGSLADKTARSRHVRFIPDSGHSSDAKLHCGELRFSKELLVAEELKDELQNFQRHVSQTGRLLFEHRTGRHDDLIFAICMPLWWSTERRKRNLISYNVVGMY
jgi:hypothetical protein